MPIQLQPTANPVNLIYTPEVRRSNRGQKLLEVANALSNTGRRLQPIMEQRHAAEVEALQAKAAADVAKWRVKNIDDFKEQVRLGNIRDTDSPWYLVGIKQSVAKVEAARADEQLRNAYDTSPVRFNDRPSEVEKWIDEQQAPLLLGTQDAYAHEVLVPVLEASKRSLVSHHVEQRSAERRVERRTGLAAEMTNLFHSSSDLATKAGALNDLAVHAGRTMTNEEINSILKEEVFAYAAVQRDPDAAETLLAGVKTAGGTLAASHQTQLELENLRTKISNDEFQDSVRAEQRRKMQIDELGRSVAKAYVTRFGANGAYDKAISDEELYADNPELADEVAAQLIVRRSRLDQIKQKKDADRTQEERDALDLLQRQLYSASDPTQKKQLADRFLEIRGGFDALSSVNRELRYEEDQARQDAITPTELLFEMENDYAAGRMSQEQLVKYLPRIPNPRERNRAVVEWFERQSRQDSGRGRGDNELDSLNHREIEQRIALGQEGFDADEETVKATAQRALVYYGRAVREIRSRNLPPNEEEKAVDEAVEKVVTAHRGATRAEWRQGTLAADRAPAVQQPAVNASTPTEPPPFPAVAQAAKLDPILGSIPAADLSAAKKVLAMPVPKGDRKLPTIYEPEFSVGMFDAGPSDALMRLMQVRKEPAQYKEVNDALGITRRDETVADAMIRHRKEALKRRLALKARLASSTDIADFRQIVAKAVQQGGASRDDQASLRRKLSLVQEYALLTRQIGFSPEEVKQAGPNAWQAMILFANETEVDRRAAEVAAYLGVPPVSSSPSSSSHRSR